MKDWKTYPHPDNFDYVQHVADRTGVRQARTQRRTFTCELAHLGEDVFRLSLSGAGWKRRAGLNQLGSDFRGARTHELRLDRRGTLALQPRLPSRAAPAQAAILGHPAGSLGVNGAAWILRLVPEPQDRYFGMGEKWGPLDKRGLRCWFWNTDVWAEYDHDRIQSADADPAYASIPYLIIERGGTFFGLLIDNPYPAYMATAAGTPTLGADPAADRTDDGGAARLGDLYLGALGGMPIVYFLMDRSLRQLTRKLQRLVGVTPRPPLWALGHHQSRWGYATTRQLSDLDRMFRKHRIPNDGLWLDIDYMDGYRVFTCKPGAVEQAELEELQARGRRVVPILDPGVKVDPGYRIYEEGIAGGHFCQAPSGRAYTGIVWPGRTHFPDFSRKATRTWWSEQVTRFAKRGFDGFWIDMNEPSTGPVETGSMLFQKGRASHDAFHNQYGYAMAMATRAGLKKAHPKRRPFLITRAASTGINTLCAMWTGDNVSSFAHLARTIPTSLNLALSGVPFHGVDVPGFGGDADARLAARFYQATFLFPFLRNHAVQGSRHQEPWALGPAALRAIRRMIVLRYRFLPYLYQLFVEQERSGEPILAPLFIDAPSSEDLLREDQFMVGPLLMQAPIVSPETRRTVLLPPGNWYCLRTGAWLSGDRSIRVRLGDEETALYVRAGALLPLASQRAVAAAQRGRTDPNELLRDIELHVFLRPHAPQAEQGGFHRAALDYTFDDGITTAYRHGEQGLARFEACRNGSRVSLEERQLGEAREAPQHATQSAARRRDPGRLRVCPVLHGFGSKRTPKLTYNGQPIRLEAASHCFVGTPLRVFTSGSSYSNCPV